MATMAKLAKSPWLLHYDGSSCNGCDIEVLACTTPKYDIERFGIINTGDPFQADILLITGGVNHQSESVIRQIYAQMPNPKVVVAVGICACTGGVFKDCYNIKGGVDTVLKDSLEQAEAILQEKEDEFYDWYDGRDLIPRIQEIKEDAVTDLELRIHKILGKLPLEEKEREELRRSIETAAGKVVNKMMFGLKDSLEKDTFQD